MTSIEDLLEEELLRLGKRELQLIEAVNIMRQEMRAAFMSGNDALGLELESQVFLIKDQIASLGPAITQIENTLYGLRNRKERKKYEQ